MMIKLHVHTFFLLYIVIYLMNSHYVLSNIPNCPFGDTVELTDAHRLDNGSYRYEGVLVPPHLIDHYDYIELYNGEQHDVPWHLRGCVCQIKNCFKLCCTPGKALYNTNPMGNCENGTLLREYDKAKLTRRDYCMTAISINETFQLQPYNCPIIETTSSTVKVNTTVMLISLPFLFLTILTYWAIPELYNILHNKCLICYLFSLAIANTMIISVNMRADGYKTVTCTIIGSVAYFFYLGAFFWLNVICFDIWVAFCRDLKNLPQNSKCKIFLKYSLYAWGLPTCMTVVTIALQFSNIPNQFKSGIGYSHCWLQIEGWSAMMYFHGPCLLLITINTIMFCLSVRKIYSDRKQFRDISRSADSARYLKSQEHSVWLFFRLFVVMGVSWILEMIGYLLGREKNDSLFFKVADGFNASQGLIIFCLFVMKKNLLLLVKERLKKTFTCLR
ncbi:G-protein coupled receptor Mth2 isoform X2 [Zeugodacus cucurbitae]|uniref:G-protein coupled receptor Mth2 isoform X2 n=1 Tax=Zeugodacus cucurbitae TaxID=28588 RepID=UPI0023D8ECAE|nr:G-protein coupled receptor Mth2 isoform X2 [Zeugodacus cucurbitae]